MRFVQLVGLLFLVYAVTRLVQAPLTQKAHAGTWVVALVSFAGIIVLVLVGRDLFRESGVSAFTQELIDALASVEVEQR